MVATLTVRRQLLCAAAVAIAVTVIGTSVAWAHSPTDFLKVPVGQRATVLLPPMRALPGLMQVSVDAPAGYSLTDVSAGPGWQSRVAANAAVLDGRRVAGTSVLVTVTGVASRPGAYPLDVRLSSTAAPTEAYNWRLTALDGYSRPVAADVGISRPDAAVDVPTSSGPPLWPVSVACALASLALLGGGAGRERRSGAVRCVARTLGRGRPG